MLRKIYITATVALMLVVMSAAMIGCPPDVRARYEVTVENLLELQTFAPLVAVTHTNEVFVFREGEDASQPFQNFVREGNTAGLVSALDNVDAVTQIYPWPQGIGLPGEPAGVLTFEIQGRPNDLFTLVAPEVIALDDSFAGLDSVPLPAIQTRTYYLFSYVLDNGDIELGTFPINLVRVTITRQN